MRDAEGSTVLLAAVRANAPLATVRKLVEGGASLVTANRRRETPIFHTRDPQVLEYLLDKLKGTRWASSHVQRLRTLLTDA